MRFAKLPIALTATPTTCVRYFAPIMLHYSGVFRVLPNIYEGAFLQNKLTAFSRSLFLQKTSIIDV